MLELVCPQPESGKICRIWHLLDLAWPLVRGGVDSFPVRSDNGVASGRTFAPVGPIRQRLGELPRDREVWLYCGVGQRAYYATRTLLQHGYKVRNLPGGWRTYLDLIAAKP